VPSLILRVLAWKGCPDFGSYRTGGYWHDAKKKPDSRMKRAERENDLVK
jgi:hypothetical protein